MMSKGHPEESLLLAYVRRQPPYDNWPAVQQHLAECKECRQRCLQYDQVGKLLEQWARSPYYTINESLSGRVLERINAPEPLLRRWLEGVKRPTTRIVAMPVALALVMFFLFLSVVAHMPLTIHTGTSQHRIVPVSKTVPSIRLTPHPTVVIKPTLTATVATDTDHDNDGPVDNDHDGDNDNNNNHGRNGGHDNKKGPSGYGR